MRNSLKIADKRGATLTGYGLIVGLIAITAIATIGRVGGGVSSLFVGVANNLEAVSTPSSGGGGSSAPSNTAPSLIAGNSFSVQTNSVALDVTADILPLFSDAEGNTPLTVASANNADGSCVTNITNTTGVITIDIAAAACTGSFDVTIADSLGLASAVTSIQVSAFTTTAIDMGIADQDWSVLAAWSFQVPSDAFEGDNLIYSATGAGGGALPTWISLDAGTQTFSGIPAVSDAGNHTLEVSVTGDDSVTVMDSYILTVNGFTLLSDILSLADDTFRCNNTSSAINCVAIWPYPSGGPWNIVTIETEVNPGFSTTSCHNSRFDHNYFFNEDVSPETGLATFGRSNSTVNNSSHRFMIETVGNNVSAPFQYDNSRKRHFVSYNATANTISGTITDIDSGNNWSPSITFASVPSVASSETIRFRPMRPQSGCTPAGVTNGEMQIISITLSQ